MKVVIVSATGGRQQMIRWAMFTKPFLLKPGYDHE